MAGYIELSQRREAVVLTFEILCVVHDRFYLDTYHNFLSMW